MWRKFSAALFAVGSIVLATAQSCEMPPTGPPVPPPTGPPAEVSCLPAVVDYTETGPLSVSTERSGRTNMWIPEGLPAGCLSPIVHFANGTGARCAIYGETMRHLASYGFIGACFEDSATGQGTQAIEAIQEVIARYGSTVAPAYGFTGHSQGGGGAIVAVYRAEQEWGSSARYAGLGVEPAHGFGDAPADYRSLYAQIQSPVAMFNGSRDGLVSAAWVRRGYNALNDNIEKAWYEGVGAAHLTPIPNSYAKEMGLAWFRWQLLDDPAACQYFKDMPNRQTWSLQETNNLSAC